MLMSYERKIVRLFVQCKCIFMLSIRNTIEYHIKLVFRSTYIYLQVGRYWALVIGLSLYVVGFTLLTTMASGFLCHRTPASPSCVPETYGILICVGIAGGTVRANIPSFGAEQVILLKFLCVFPC